MHVRALSFARFAGEHRAQFELMFSAVLETGATGIGGGRNLRSLEEMIRQGQQTGEVRQGDPILLARVVWALVHGASMLRMDGDNALSGLSSR